MFYVFMNTGEQGTWVQFSVGYDTRPQADIFLLKLSQREMYKEYSKCVMEMKL